MSESSAPSRSRSRAKPLRTYGKRSLPREDSSSVKKRRVSTEVSASGTSESKNTETEPPSLPKIGAGESKDTPEPSTAASKPIANPIKKGSILSFFKPIPSSSTAASSPKSDEPQPEATPPSSPPQPPRIETRKKPRLLRFRGSPLPLLDSENTESDNKDDEEIGAEEKSGAKPTRPALRESSLNRESSTSDTKPTKKEKLRPSTVQTTLNLSSQAAFSECKVCNTVWNPLYPDDVKFHTKQHAAVLRAKRKEKENEL